MGFKEVARTVLKQEGRPLSAEEIVAIAKKNGNLKTSGKTPAATMSAQIYVDLKNNGENSQFVKIGRGKFGLRELEQQNKTEFREFSFKDAAYNVLKSENKPLSPEKITELAIKKGFLKTRGKTPWASMGAQLYVDVRDLKENSQFVQLGKNKFGLREWGIEVIKDEIEKEETEKAKSEKSMRKRSIVGEPINFEGLTYAPLNENGVIFLFSKLHKDFNIIIEAIQAGYPDAKGRQKTSKGFEDIWIEFEYKSSNFKRHGHDPKDCDIIVCWEHDWKDCPLKVIELKREICPIQPVVLRRFMKNKE